MRSFVASIVFVVQVEPVQEHAGLASHVVLVPTCARLIELGQICATLVVIELEIVRGDHGGGRDEREEVDGSGHVRGWMTRPEVRRARSNLTGKERFRGFILANSTCSTAPFRDNKILVGPFGGAFRIDFVCEPVSSSSGN